MLCTCDVIPLDICDLDDPFKIVRLWIEVS